MMGRQEGAALAAGQPVPAEGTVYALLAAQAERFADHELLCLPEAVAALWEETRRAITYGAALAEADTLAATYRAAGYGPGHRVALLLENRPAHYLHWLALNSLGVSIVPLNPDYRESELSYVVGHSEAALIVALPARHASVTPVAAALGVPLAAPGDPLPAPGRAAGPAATGRAAECALLYTSGTTGTPKGCLLSNAYFLGWGDWYIAQQGLIALSPGEERLMTPLPTFHVNAMGNSFIGMLRAGGTQIIIDRFHPRDWWATAIETGATCFHYLGVMPAILLALPEAPEETRHALRFGMGGGVHPDHHAAFEARFGVPLLEGWAMTECGGAGILCAMVEPRHVGERCLGRPDRAGPPLEALIVDDAGAPVAKGVPGELLIRARGDDPRARFFSGYFKDPAATEAIWQGGYLHTGDIMREGPDGALHFVDRKKNIIRRSGENIAAIEVESAIAAHPSVRQVAVVAVLDPIRGEEVLAAIVLQDGNAPDRALAEAILAHSARSLAYYKTPGYVAFLDSLPTTATQKVRKADLGALTEDPAAHPDCHDLRAEKQALREGGR
ncbi:AMP-binding protein [Acuticoccus kandeliae]|uniref:AMP-binding protein n=1 Tax=Acuticoccus kandeliae TaxID=2073160 RepID=UPI00196B58D4|nr:AMP-binding protein [Acuticoccus kandeliae]